MLELAAKFAADEAVAYRVVKLEEPVERGVEAMKGFRVFKGSLTTDGAREDLLEERHFAVCPLDMRLEEARVDAVAFEFVGGADERDVLPVDALAACPVAPDLQQSHVV